MDNIKFVLVGTTHPGNIGASARAMKTMGCQALRLVQPETPTTADSYAMASGADDILDAAQTFDDLSDAIADCALVIGTTARRRTLSWPTLSPREAASRGKEFPADKPIAIVFGREHSGLSNDEVALCHQLIRIPTAADFSSLNLAQAVQICAYEFRLQCNIETEPFSAEEVDDPPASSEAAERLYDHLIAVMTEVGYLFPENPRLLPQRVRRLLAKAHLSVTETQILRGFLAAVEKWGRKT
ncbi:MAG: RNA methyltransferase [Pseudomonadota bacterium]